MGALGQGGKDRCRLKKFHEDNTAKAAQNKPVEQFSVSRMVISIHWFSGMCHRYACERSKSCGGWKL